jgi:hypothetical protein
MMNKRILVALLALSAFLDLHSAEDANSLNVKESGASAKSYTFFDGGKANCEIVVPEKAEPEELEAAELLKSIFQKMGKTDVPVVKSASASPIIHIHVGQTRLGTRTAESLFPGNFDADGYLIFPADEGNLVIAGKRPLSTFYAAVDFLERYAGVLWVWPNDNGIVIPETGKFTASVTKQVSEPVFKSRRFSGIEEGQGKYWKINQESKGLREIRGQFSHNVRRVLVPEYWETHPEYFNMRYGKRIKPAKFSQACTSNPAVIKIYVEAAKKQFKDYPWIESFSVSAGDGGNFCECDKCRALDIPGVEGNSDRYFTFANAVADGIRDEFPGKTITCLAYGKETRNVPVKVKLRPNVMPYIVIPAINDPREDIVKWGRAARILGVYFHLHGKAVPKFFPHKFAEYLRFLSENNVREVYAEVYQNSSKQLSSYELDGPRVWISAKLLWNPNEDVDKLMETFCSRFYGAAAKPMLRYYQQCEKAWGRTKNPFDFRREYLSYEFDIYTLEDMNLMTAALAEALRLADGDTPVLERLKAQQRALFPIAAYYQFEDIPEAVSALPMNNIDDAAASMSVVNRRAEAAAKYNPEAPLRFISKDVSAFLDGHLAAISAKLGKDALKFWENSAARYPLLSSFIQPQILTCSGKISNMAVNPGFESPEKKKSKVEADLEDLNIPGWSKWIRLNTSGKVIITSETARSGKNSLLLEACKAASGNQTVKVEPGQRYRISCWVKTDVENTGEDAQAYGKMTVSWKSSDGKWLNRANNIYLELKTGDEDWQNLSTVATVPVGATSMVIMLGVGEQGDSGKTWFDDICVEPLYSKNPDTDSDKKRR